ncbi:MAG: DUF481 domain-containing protein, partial [Bacteroides sp.]|nr:DUF481 domain-containing protein [Bacteroides sp.]
MKLSHFRKTGLFIFILSIHFISIEARADGRQKIDKVTLQNGDVITCEIKQLEYGLLKAKTDDAGTLEIKWNKVTRISSTYIFEVEMQDGTVYFGKFGQVDSDQKVSIVSGPTVKVVDMLQIVAIAQIENRFWSRLDGSVSLGLNLAQANDLLQWNSNFNTTYRSRSYFSTISYSGNYTTQSEQDATQRQDANLVFTKNLPQKWLAYGYFGANNNTEQGLKLRLSLGMGPGIQLIQSNQNVLGAVAGLVASREWSLDEEGIRDNMLEGLLVMRFSRFKYDSPKSNITTQMNFYPGLSPWGRYRAELNL